MDATKFLRRFFRHVPFRVFHPFYSPGKNRLHRHNTVVLSSRGVDDDRHSPISLSLLSVAPFDPSAGGWECAA